MLTDYPRQIEIETGFVRRSTAKLDGPVFVRGLVLGWMAQPEASYSQLRSSLATLGANVSSQAVEQRFGEASVKLFKEVVQEAIKQVICHEGEVPELFSRFNGVYNQDGSILSPGQSHLNFESLKRDHSKTGAVLASFNWQYEKC